MLDKFEPIVKLLPEIRSPTRVPAINERLFWTVSALMIFFLMYGITAIGLKPNTGQVDFISIVTAGRTGSLVTVGIGPIVIASILLQLLKGAKILNINMQDTKQRSLYLGVQKLLAILLAFVEAYVFIAAGRVVFLDGFENSIGMHMFVVLQIALGSIILLYLDEVVTKYGMGSGISMFIAGGVSLAIVGGTIDILAGQNGMLASLNEPSALTFAEILKKSLPLWITLLVILINVYVDGLKIEIPIATGMMRMGARGFPLKFLYVSNLPVILASAFLIHFQLLAVNVVSHGLVINGFDIGQYIAYGDNTGPYPQVLDGLFYFMLPPTHFSGSGINGTDLLNFYSSYLFMNSPISHIPGWLHIIIYIVFFTILCIFSGFLWIETSGMGAKDLAEQLLDAGWSIRGFRADPRLLETFLNRYIPAITLLGSAFVGILASVADLLGALGTGTGILLTVSIFARLNQDFKTYQLYDLYPGIGKMFEK